MLVVVDSDVSAGKQGPLTRDDLRALEVLIGMSVTVLFVASACAFLSVAFLLPCKHLQLVVQLQLACPHIRDSQYDLAQKTRWRKPVASRLFKSHSTTNPSHIVGLEDHCR